MKRFVATFLTVAILGAFSLGCADIRIKPNEVKCPNAVLPFLLTKEKKSICGLWVLVVLE